MGKYQKLFTSSQPTINTLTGFNRSAGISDTGATTLALQKSTAETVRAREAASGAFGEQTLRTEGLAQGYLGQEYDRAKSEMEGYTGYQQGLQRLQTSFFDQVLGLGGGLLSKQLLNRNAVAPASTYQQPSYRYSGAQSEDEYQRMYQGF